MRDEHGDRHGHWPGERGQAKSDTAKVELYTRWSFYCFGGFEVGLLAFPGLASGAREQDGWLFLLVRAHATLCTVLRSKALDWRLGRRERPVRLLLATAALSAAGIVVILALLRAEAIPGSSVFTPLLLGFGGFGLAATSLALRTAARMVFAVLGTAAGTAGASLVVGLPGDQSGWNAVGVLATGTGLVFAYVFSAWLVHTVWELDAAREPGTRLAVAEERLRFGRDLHDVMGRNLAVIALKSELAVQLAERGRPEAVAHMAEVQQIAQDSQREVREVVRGYREVDLHNELEGARGVLKAAGIDCRIEGDDGGALPAEVRSALGWVVREATTNVLRHGDAAWCTVRLSAREGPEAVLIVENDGVPDGTPEMADSSGSSGHADPRKGSGLTGLRERRTALGGTLDAGRAGGGRFRLTARVPVPGAGSGPAATATSTAAPEDRPEAKGVAGVGSRSGSGCPSGSPSASASRSGSESGSGSVPRSRSGSGSGAGSGGEVAV
ncbi:sensor histidine kinase [Streptomyces sp. NPDC051569]|uniref:sensor histidine kinase n=1 Tax=Streptomyces sp. NPDC051569 TaxID=3365661 RepID=UPI00379ECDD2